MHRFYQRLIASMLLLYALITAAVPTAVSYAGQVTTKKQTTRDIAIVFDNSGSMYLKGKKDWCQATYAIEVFARMMNEGDTLSVHPMNEIEVSGQKYTWDTPLIIKNASEASKIRDISTPEKADDPVTPQKENSLDTHIETIQAAFNVLKKSDADQQWIIVLTDGDEFYRDGVGLGKGEMTQKALEEELATCASSVNTMYMGIGSVAAMPEIKGKFGHESVEARNSADVPQKLSQMCNVIFGRSELSGSNVTDDGRGINFDIPLSKLIVFVQGEGIQVNTLKDSAGKLIQSSSAVETRYSEKGAEHYKNVQGIDKTLQGMLVTYEGLEKGEYSLDYDGQANSIAYYYEPNADLFVDIVDQDGLSILGESFNPEEFYSGDYVIEYKLTEPGKTEPLESALLGDISYDIRFLKNGEAIPMTETGRSGSIPVSFETGDTLEFEKAEARFLKDYSIVKTPDEVGFNSNGYIPHIRPAELAMTSTWEQRDILRSRLEIDGIYEYVPSYNGEVLTPEEISTMSFKAVVTGGDVEEGKDNPVCTVSQSGDRIIIQLEYNEEAAKTRTGPQTLEFEAHYTDEFGMEAVGKEEVVFNLLDDTKTVSVVSIDTEKSYYLLNELGKNAPVAFTIAVDGKPATDEELDAICADPLRSIQLETEKNLSLDKTHFTPVKGRSQIITQISPDGTKKGRSSLVATVSVPNTREQVYRGVQSDKKFIEVENIPRWLRWLVIGIILLILAILIFSILNMKILPRDIFIKQAETEFTSDGDEVTGNNTVRYGRKSIFGRLFSDTSLVISSIPDSGGQSISPVQLKIKRESKVKDVLFEKRRCKVLATLTEPSNTISDLSVAGVAFSYNEDEQHFMDDSDRLPKDHPIKIGEGSNVEINEAVSGFRGTKYLSYTTNLHMKW